MVLRSFNDKVLRDAERRGFLVNGDGGGVLAIESLTKKKLKGRVDSYGEIVYISGIRT